MRALLGREFMRNEEGAWHGWMAFYFCGLGTQELSHLQNNDGFGLCLYVYHTAK